MMESKPSNFKLVVLGGSGFSIFGIFLWLLAIYPQLYASLTQVVQVLSFGVFVILAFLAFRITYATLLLLLQPVRDTLLVPTLTNFWLSLKLLNALVTVNLILLFVQILHFDFALAASCALLPYLMLQLQTLATDIELLERTTIV